MLDEPCRVVAVLSVILATALVAQVPGPAVDATPAEQATLSCLAEHEAGGELDPTTAVSPNGKYGGPWQFDALTWASVGGEGLAQHASWAEQFLRALLLLRDRGVQPWPENGPKCAHLLAGLEDTAPAIVRPKPARMKVARVRPPPKPLPPAPRVREFIRCRFCALASVS
jgi:Transglycosylase-like domain